MVAKSCTSWELLVTMKHCKWWDYNGMFTIYQPVQDFATTVCPDNPICPKAGVKHGLLELVLHYLSHWL